MRRTALKHAAGCFLVALLPALVGCSDSDDPEQEKCDATPPTRGSHVDGALSIGLGGPTDFRPFVEGEPAELVQGLQGGYMLLPGLRVDAAPFGGSANCAQLELAAVVDAVDVAPLVLRVPAPNTENGYFYVGPLPLFLSNNLADLEGKACLVSAAFRDDETEATAEVSVLLVTAVR